MKDILRYVSGKKATALAVVLLLLLNDVSFALSPVPGTQEPVLRCEYQLLTWLRSGRLKFADTEEDIRFLKEFNHAETLLLSHGMILAAKELKSDPVKLLRKIIHEEVEAVMQIMAKEERSKYSAIINMVLSRSNIREKYYELFPHGQAPILEDELLANDIIAKAFEILIPKVDRLIEDRQIAPEESAFLNTIIPVINANKHNYFTGIFWETKVRESKIRVAMANGMGFTQVASSKSDGMAGPQNNGGDKSRTPPDLSEKDKLDTAHTSVKSESSPAKAPSEKAVSGSLASYSIKDVPVPDQKTEDPIKVAQEILVAISHQVIDSNIQTTEEIASSLKKYPPDFALEVLDRVFLSFKDVPDDVRRCVLILYANVSTSFKDDQHKLSILNKLSKIIGDFHEGSETSRRALNSYFSVYSSLTDSKNKLSAISSLLAYEGHLHTYANQLNSVSYLYLNDVFRSDRDKLAVMDYLSAIVCGLSVDALLKSKFITLYGRISMTLKDEASKAVAITLLQELSYSSSITAEDRNMAKLYHLTITAVMKDDAAKLKALGVIGDLFDIVRRDEDIVSLAIECYRYIVVAIQGEESRTIAFDQALNVFNRRNIDPFMVFANIFRDDKNRLKALWYIAEKISKDAKVDIDSKRGMIGSYESVGKSIKNDEYKARAIALLFQTGRTMGAYFAIDVINSSMAIAETFDDDKQKISFLNFSIPAIQDQNIDNDARRNLIERFANLIGSFRDDSNKFAAIKMLNGLSKGHVIALKEQMRDSLAQISAGFKEDQDKISAIDLIWADFASAGSSYLKIRIIALCYFVALKLRSDQSKSVVLNRYLKILNDPGEDAEIRKSVIRPFGNIVKSAEAEQVKLAGIKELRALFEDGSMDAETARIALVSYGYIAETLRSDHDKLVCIYDLFRIIGNSGEVNGYDVANICIKIIASMDGIQQKNKSTIELFNICRENNILNERSPHVVRDIADFIETLGQRARQISWGEIENNPEGALHFILIGLRIVDIGKTDNILLSRVLAELAQRGEEVPNNEIIKKLRSPKQSGYIDDLRSSLLIISGKKVYRISTKDAEDYVVGRYKDNINELIIALGSSYMNLWNHSIDFKDAESILKKVYFNLINPHKVELLKVQQFHWIINQPVYVGDMRLRSRLSIVAMNSNDSPAGFPSEVTLNRYRRYAQSGASVIFSESSNISDFTYRGGMNLIVNKNHADGVKRLVAAVKGINRDLKFIFQIGLKIKKESEVDLADHYQASIKGLQPLYKTLSAKEIIDMYADAAEVVYRAGGDGVELKAAHSSLLLNFLRPANDRRDQYGGQSLENRARIVKDIVEEIRRRVPDRNFKIGIRVSVESVSDEITQRLPGCFGTASADSVTEDLSDMCKMLKLLYDYGIQIFSISAGKVASATLEERLDKSAIVAMIPDQLPDDFSFAEPESYNYLRYSAAVKQYFKERGINDAVVVCAGLSIFRKGLPYVASLAVLEDSTDLIGIGRQAFADPDIYNILSGDFNPCIQCNHCFFCLLHSDIYKSPSGCAIWNDTYRIFRWIRDGKPAKKPDGFMDSEFIKLISAWYEKAPLSIKPAMAVRIADYNEQAKANNQPMIGLKNEEVAKEEASGNIASVTDKKTHLNTSSPTEDKLKIRLLMAAKNLKNNVALIKETQHFFDTEMDELKAIIASLCDSPEKIVFEERKDLIFQTVRSGDRLIVNPSVISRLPDLELEALLLYGSVNLLKRHKKSYDLAQELIDSLPDKTAAILEKSHAGKIFRENWKKYITIMTVNEVESEMAAIAYRITRGIRDVRAHFLSIAGQVDDLNLKATYENLALTLQSGPKEVEHGLILMRIKSLDRPKVMLLAGIYRLEQKALPFEDGDKFIRWIFDLIEDYAKKVTVMMKESDGVGVDRGAVKVTYKEEQEAAIPDPEIIQAFESRVKAAFAGSANFGMSLTMICMKFNKEGLSEKKVKDILKRINFAERDGKWYKTSDGTSGEVCKKTEVKPSVVEQDAARQSKLIEITANSGGLAEETTFTAAMKDLEETSWQEFGNRADETSSRAVSYEQKSQSLIIYADDMLESALVIDLENTIKNILAKHNVLNGGKIILYSKNEASAAILGKMIKHADPNLKTVKITQGDLQISGDEAKEVDALLRVARAKGAKELLGLIRGPTDKPEELAVFAKEVNLPIIIVGPEKGIYSFAQAIAMAIDAKINNGATNGWLIMLPPIRTLTDDIRRQYEEYQHSLQALVAA